MSFENSDPDQLSIKEINEKIEQTREQRTKVESVRIWGTWTFIVCIILALIYVCICYSDIEHVDDSALTMRLLRNLRWYCFEKFPDFSFNSRFNPETFISEIPLWRREDILGDVLCISLLLSFPFIMYSRKLEAVRGVVGGVQPFFLFGVALAAECCGIFLDYGGFTTYASLMLFATPIMFIVIVCEVIDEEAGRWRFVLLLMVVSAFIVWCCFAKSSVYPFNIWLYVIEAFCVTIIAAWLFNLGYDEEGDRLRELVCEYEKKIKERQEEELSDEGKLKRAIDRFRV